jgi:hypothetical protein
MIDTGFAVGDGSFRYLTARRTAVRLGSRDQRPDRNNPQGGRLITPQTLKRWGKTPSTNSTSGWSRGDHAIRTWPPRWKIGSTQPVDGLPDGYVFRRAPHGDDPGGPGVLGAGDSGHAPQQRLIINTLNALLSQQMRQIGIMKLVGASPRGSWGCT